MEVTRVYPKGNDVVNGVRTRKTINPNAVLSYEEVTVNPNYTTVITPHEAFVIEESYDEFMNRLRSAKLTETDGGVQY